MLGTVGDFLGISRGRVLIIDCGLVQLFTLVELIEHVCFFTHYFFSGWKDRDIYVYSRTNEYQCRILEVCYNKLHSRLLSVEQKIRGLRVLSNKSIFCFLY